LSLAKFITFLDHQARHFDRTFVFSW
jgi:hypothetical protein